MLLADTIPAIHTDYFYETYPGAAKTYGQGTTFVDECGSDTHHGNHKNNIYYPFASQQEWELAAFLLKSKLSMSDIDEFLRLDIVSCHWSHPFNLLKCHLY